MVLAVQLVVTLNAKEHEVVPSVGDTWIVDVVRRQRYLVMYNPPLPFSVMPDKLIVASLTDI